MCKLACYGGFLLDHVLSLPVLPCPSQSMNKSRLTRVLTDIRFWILFFFALRLVGITNAPLEIGHNWRQSLTNMIARNFLENGAHILYPAIDMAGEKTGIIGSEFPFFNYLIYCASKLFGYSHWAGRLINLVVSSLGLFYFYRLVKNLIDRRTAFNATIILTVSIWFAFSRKIMPDTFSVSLVVMGLYYAYDYLRNGGWLRLVLFFTLCTLGMLCKIPALSLFSALAVLLFIKELDGRRKLAVYVTGSFSFIVVCVWYFYWVPFLLDTYQYQLYFPKGIVEGMREISFLIPELFEKFYFSALHSFLALICLIVGVVAIIQSRQRILILALAIVSSVFVLFMFKTGAVFPLHNYYIIPYTLVMALLAGFGVARIPSRYQYVLLALICVEAIANQQHDFFIADNQRYKLELEDISQQIIPTEDLIVINGGQSPQDIYFSHRKGWTVNNEKLTSPQFLDSLVNLGASYLIIDRFETSIQFDSYQSVFENENYSIYNLND